MSTINAAGETLAKIEHRLQVIKQADEEMKAETLSRISAIEEAIAALREFIETSAADKARAISATIGEEAPAQAFAMAAE